MDVSSGPPPPPPPEKFSGKPENTCQQKKAPRRVRWTDDLHGRFLKAVDTLGGEHCATPKAVLALMDEKELTVTHVKSHLQLHRSNKMEKNIREAEANTALMMDNVMKRVKHNNVAQYPSHNQPQQGHSDLWDRLPPLPPPSLPPLSPSLLPPLSPSSLLSPPPPARYYIDPLGPVPPSIPPCMRRMNFSTPWPQPITFVELFARCNEKDINNNAEVESSTGSTSSLITSDEINNDDVSLDLTLGHQPNPRS